MSREHYDENCPGCRPAMVDMKTGKLMKQNHPMMKIANQVFDTFDIVERRAWHRFTCQNARDPAALAAAAKFHDGLKARAEELN